MQKAKMQKKKINMKIKEKKKKKKNKNAKMKRMNDNRREQWCPKRQTGRRNKKEKKNIYESEDENKGQHRHNEIYIKRWQCSFNKISWW